MTWSNLIYSGHADSTTDPSLLYLLCSAVNDALARVTTYRRDSWAWRQLNVWGTILASATASPSAQEATTQHIIAPPERR